MAAVKVHLKPRKAQPFYARHPWVLDSAIDRLEGEAADGSEVDLVNERGQWVARGLYNSHSRIRVRLYSWQAEEPLGEAFWRARIESAVRLRSAIGYNDPRGAARLVFSEADGLSGLIVDRFGSHLVVQPTALAMGQRMVLLAKILSETLHPAGIVVRVDEGTLRREGLELEAGVYSGKPPDDVLFIEEHGVRYGVQLLQGQKTGFYLDQRENRLAAAKYMAGRHVLDMCCYTGGFSLTAAVVGKAAEVLGVDTSEHAVTMARANAQLNGLSNVHFEQGDLFQWLEERVATGQRFGAVVLDPPKFARGKAGIEAALRAYHRINQLAVELLEPEGVLVTCSCSGNVSSDDFASMLFGVAQKTRRDIQIVERRGAAPDHPTSVLCPETEYLKCFICRVK
jgi:23S rRNA (cytosine1962-C5)-methyltransferase